MYNRNKRLFTRKVLSAYQSLGRSTAPTRYGKEHRRLRDYAEVLFIACGQKVDVNEDEVVQALSLVNLPAVHQQQFAYVAHLLVSELTNMPAKHFSGEFICGNCGGDFVRNRISDGYICVRCGRRGKEDQHGFPVSIPCSNDVIAQRRVFHDNIRMLGQLGVTTDESYTLVAFQMNIPQFMVHAGLCVSIEQISELVVASQCAIENIKKVLERAVRENVYV